MGRRARIGIGIGVVAMVGVALLARHAIAQMLVSFHTPHVVRAPTATLDLTLANQVDTQARTATMTTPDELVTFALHVTANALHFGLSHRTRMSFDASEREGNCVEYAELFASVLNREHGSVDAHAWVVRSDAKILGTTSQDPALKDHDWVLVVVRMPSGARQLYVDPTLYDMGLGWDISRAVRGDVRPPP